jgi:hypothetical protein
MKSLGLKDKILISVFVIVFFAGLWLLSPMSKVYLPQDTSRLEKKLSISLPETYVLKNSKTYGDATAFNLVNNENQPHVLSIIIFNDNNLTLEQIGFSEETNPSIKDFWLYTGLVNPELTHCIPFKLKNKAVTKCKLNAKKPGMNEFTSKEGEVYLFEKNKHSVFLFSVASQMAYEPEITGNLVNRILK